MPRDTPRMMGSAMRVTALTAGFILGAAFVSIIGLTAIPAMANKTSLTCLCGCPDDQKLKPRHAAARPIVPRRASRRNVYHDSQANYYSYRAAAPLYPREWHGPWHVVPNDAAIPGPAPVAMAYYSAPVHLGPPGLTIDQRGWNGGVGNEDEGGGVTGQVLVITSANHQNGPSYNSYNQSLQENPSVPRPFQNQLMGRLAPTSSSTRLK